MGWGEVGGYLHSEKLLTRGADLLVQAVGILGEGVGGGKLMMVGNDMFLKHTH